MSFLVAFGLCVFVNAWTLAQSKNADPLDTRAVELLESHCFDCHSGTEPEGGLDLTHFKTVGSMRLESDIWGKVLQRTNNGSMPPPEMDPLPESDKDWLVQWVDDALHKIDCSDRSFPGQVTVRRLTRLEYRNSIRDLVGVDYLPSAGFPGDDVGYGFDNIGEVLSLPPVLMEKYLDAAEKISAQVISTPEDYQPELHKVNLGDWQTEGGVNKNQRVVFYSNGKATANLEVTDPGRYQISIAVEGQQAGNEPCKMTVSIDEKTVRQYEIAGKDKRETIKFIRRLGRGTTKLTVSFDNDFYDKSAPKGQQDRNLLLHEATFVGPDKPTVSSLSDLHKNFFFVYPKKESEESQAAAKLLSVWSSRFFRRPTAQHEVQDLLKIYQSVRADGASFEKAMQVSLMAIMVSPKFLFKIERPAPEDGSIRDLSNYELATSLSYFLWASTPDEELLKFATQQDLSKTAALRIQIRRMLESRKADVFIENFASQWLQLRILEGFEPDPDKYKGVDALLLADMRTETEMFCRSILREDRSLLELLNGDFTFVNGRLANHYGIGNVPEDSKQFVKVSLAGSQRGGLLTQGSILAVTSNPTRTSPVKRGKWIMENLLGEPPPPAAPDVVPLDKQELTGTLRQRMEQHRVDPACASCHQLMDPLGFALENYDPVGRWRDRDEGGPIDPSGVLPTGENFQGIGELKEILTGAHKDKFVRCVTEKMLIYALGRGLRYEDQCAVNEIVARLEANDYRMSELIFGIVESAPFRQRQLKTEE